MLVPPHRGMLVVMLVDLVFLDFLIWIDLDLQDLGLNLLCYQKLDLKSCFSWFA